MQVNKMGEQALDEAASIPPILCLILFVLEIESHLGLHRAHYAIMELVPRFVVVSSSVFHVPAFPLILIVEVWFVGA